jgi:hypothetical protein
MTTKAYSISFQVQLSITSKKRQSFSSIWMRSIQWRSKHMNHDMLLIMALASEEMSKLCLSTTTRSASSIWMKNSSKLLKRTSTKKVWTTKSVKYLCATFWNFLNWKWSTSLTRFWWIGA